jgi:hypothetical protein
MNIRSNKPLVESKKLREFMGKVVTITKAELNETQYKSVDNPKGEIAIFTTTEFGPLTSFNGAPRTDAKAMIEGKIVLPKAVKIVQAKSKKTGRLYIALEEA